MIFYLVSGDFCFCVLNIFWWGKYCNIFRVLIVEDGVDFNEEIKKYSIGIWLFVFSILGKL